MSGMDSSPQFLGLEVLPISIGAMLIRPRTIAHFESLQIKLQAPPDDGLKIGYRVLLGVLWLRIVSPTPTNYHPQQDFE